jgi:hypothetical protein
MYYIVYRTKLNEQQDVNVVPTEDVEEDESIFTKEEEKFLAMFDAYQNDQLGIIYSNSDIGIQEFIDRSGKQYNCTPGVLKNLIDTDIIEIAPYGGHGRDTSYTIKLKNITLKDLIGFAKKANIQPGQSDSSAAGGDTAAMDMGGGAPPPPAPPTEEPPAAEEPAPAPGPENASVLRYGTVLTESAKAVKHVLFESKKKSDLSNIHTEKSRMLKELPKEYLKHLNSVITHLSKRSFSVSEKKKLIADILDNLSVNLKLTPKQIFASYEMYKNQKKLNDFLNKK